MNRPADNPIDPLRRLAGNVVTAVGVIWSLLCVGGIAFFLYLIFKNGLKGSTTGGLVWESALVLVPGVIGLGLGWLTIASGRAIGGRRGKKDLGAE